MKFKKVMLITAAFVLAGSMAACSHKDDTQQSQNETAQTEKSSQGETEDDQGAVQGSAVEPQEEIPANQNLLTGVPDLTDGAIGKRPVAVMVNNVSYAMPQYGVGQADIIFEIPVEGDATRFMALYGDYTQVPQICPIRSCRYYFPALSQGFDAFYVNWGIDDTMADYLEALNMDQIEGITNTGGLFGRDQDRLNQGYSLEHTGYFDGTKLVSYIESQGLRTDLNEDKKGPAFQFNGLEEQLKPEGSDCTSVQINFGAQSSQFTYDAENKVYLKQINGDAQVDGKTGEQLAFTNVFVLETDISVRDSVGHKEIDWDGGTDSVGYYVSNGGVQKITWSKDYNNESSYLRFYDESGQEISINRGKSYIALNYKNQAVFQ
ncbi:MULTISPECIES: DUF3048 domain-containing protein [unclassified Blautia]|uniref:DUF3048 domain-containing protein n=1 Tax=unclassified Blautia TaxID=2648079 RepID=UPI000B38D989|nr:MULTISPECIES: DUF3048 domain-containing protein [unclassified Blautia]OUN25669.1 hypothetical protein B5G33_17680 [Blautia sp. An81]OUN93997.1 hypothetical protein B5G00_03815 [Blautia sp. An46]